jgi:AAA ATPase domain
LSALSDLRSSTLVGRTEEVAHCSGLLASADGAGLVITGAAGVGKTRLATEVLRAAEDAGYATTRVTATEAGGAIPLGPFVHLLPTEANSPPLHLLRAARAQLSERDDGRPLALLVDDAHLRPSRRVRPPIVALTFKL